MLVREGERYRPDADLELVSRGAMTFGAGLQLAALRGRPREEVLRQLRFLLQTLEQLVIQGVSTDG